MKKRILVTDDTEDILTNLKEYLEMEDYEVDTARNGKEALAQVRQRMPDLIITDLLMNEMTGFELIKELKKIEAFRKIPVIVFSAKPIQGEEELAELGADRFVLKPSSPEVLVDNVAELLKE